MGQQSSRQLFPALFIMSPLSLNIHHCLCDLHTQRERKPIVNRQGKYRDSLVGEVCFPFGYSKHSVVPVKMIGIGV